MFKKKKKMTLQELQKEFDIQQYKLGGIIFQMDSLDSEMKKIIHYMHALTKEGREIKSKISEEVAEKVEEGKNMEPVENENA